MKIKRFYAKTMRAALQQVRDEQGPESVILSKRRVDDGIEVIAAVDYDEGLLHQWAQQRPADAPPAGQAAPAQSAAATRPATAARTTGPARHAGTAAYQATFDGVVPDLPTPEQPDPGSTEPPSSRHDQDAGTRTPDFRSIFEAAGTIATLPEPGVRADVGRLDEIASRLARLEDTVSAQFGELHWDELQRRRPKLAEVIRRLDLLGLDRTLVRSIVNHLDPADDRKKAWRAAIGQLAKRIPIATGDVCEDGGVFAIVGATGAGKTTSIAKLAARYAISHGANEVGLVTTDSYRIGAHDQLFRFGKILGVPVQVAADADALRATLDQLSSRRLVLIDTAGFSPRDGEMFARLEALTARSPSIQTLLTLPANTQTASLKESIRAFDRLGLDGTIVTKVDEATSLGGVLSAVIEAALAVCYVADGQRVPEDIRPATRYRAEFVSQAVSLAKRFAEAAGEDAGEDADGDAPIGPTAADSAAELPPMTKTEKRVASYG